MKLYPRDTLVKKIENENTSEGVLAAKLHGLLEDCNLNYKGLAMSDFLQDKKLFDEAKYEIYDILTDEHQKSLDMAERILWGSKKDEERSKKQNMETHNEMFSQLKTNFLFREVKKLANGDYSNLDFIVMWELLVRELHHIDPKFDIKSLGFESFEKFGHLGKSKIIIMSLKSLIKFSGLILLPEYRGNDGAHSILDGNMNATAVIMGIPFSEEWTTIFSEKSMDFMMRLKSDYFGLVMYYFDIDTPEKLNNLMNRFEPYTKICEENGATLEGQPNAFVEFILDSFGSAKGLSNHIEHFKIKTLTDFEKLFPYGIINGKMSKFNNEHLKTEVSQIYQMFGIDTVNKYVEFLSIDNDKFDKIIEVFKSYDTELLENILKFFECTNSTESFAFLKDDRFIELLDGYKKHATILGKYDLEYDVNISKKDYMFDVFNMLELSEKNNYNGTKLVVKKTEKEDGLDKDNWKRMILGYAKANNNEDPYGINDELKKKYNDLFDGIEAKDFVYDHIYQIYTNVINNNDNQNSYKDLATINALENLNVGNMSSTTLLVNITKNIRDLSRNEKTPPQTKEKTIEGMQILEDKIKNWPMKDKTDLYGSLSNLLKISPAINSICLEICNNISNKDLKYFVKNTLPIFISRILLLKKNINQERYGEPKYGYKPRDLQTIHAYIKNTKDKIVNSKNHKKSGEEIKMEILHNMQEQIKLQFGLKELPIEKLIDDRQTIQNYLTYLSNIFINKEEYTKILGFLFGLQINDLRLDFRTGKEIDFSAIFEDGILSTLRSYIENQKDDMLFQEYDQESKEVFQQDTVYQHIGEINTIDTSLFSLNENIKDLIDPDNFISDEEKELLNISLINGKELGKTLALSFQGKVVEGNILEIKMKLDSVFGFLDKEKVEYIQDLLKNISPIVNFVKNVEKLNLKDKIDNLNQIKLPSAKIVNVFEKLGEKFSTSSGVIPVTNDLNYLNQIVNQQNNSLNQEEIHLANEYIDIVKKQLDELQEDKTRIQELFGHMKYSLSGRDILMNNNILSDRIKELHNFVYPESIIDIETTKIITAKITSDMNIIIENIRGCLQCTQKEINNFHNITFGDSNKFFVAIYGDDKTKTIADCIVDIFPYEIDSEENEDVDTKIHNDNPDDEELPKKNKTFVIERVYGERTPDVLISIIKSLIKKKSDSGIKNIDILVSKPALESCNANIELIENALKNDNLDIQEVQTTVDIAKSPTNLGYYEFADKREGDIRGEQKTSGVLVKFKE